MECFAEIYRVNRAGRNLGQSVVSHKIKESLRPFVSLSEARGANALKQYSLFTHVWHRRPLLGLGFEEETFDDTLDEVVDQEDSDDNRFHLGLHCSRHD